MSFEVLGIYIIYIYIIIDNWPITSSTDDFPWFSIVTYWHIVTLNYQSIYIYTTASVHLLARTFWSQRLASSAWGVPEMTASFAWSGRVAALEPQVLVGIKPYQIWINLGEFPWIPHWIIHLSFVPRWVKMDDFSIQPSIFINFSCGSPSHP